jgi:hypothetical protein
MAARVSGTVTSRRTRPTRWTRSSGLNGDLAARSRAAALTEAAALVDEETNASAAGRDEVPFRRQE